MMGTKKETHGHFGQAKNGLLESCLSESLKYTKNDSNQKGMTLLKY